MLLWNYVKVWRLYKKVLISCLLIYDNEVHENITKHVLKMSRIKLGIIFYNTDKKKF